MVVSDFSPSQTQKLEEPDYEVCERVVTATPSHVAGQVNDITDLIEEARSGRVFILVDDKDRENEGDLVIPAQFATPEVINFMIRHARGLVCLAMTRRRVEELGLPLMRQSNSTRLKTAFTVSIEARDGVTTGISAHDRARTIAVAINPESQPTDLASPGHIFPLMARDGGTLIRAGHTEAAVDIARLAGLNSAAVICEIINDDGSMARLPDLFAFARLHRIKLGTIADLIAYRRRTERLVRRVHEDTLQHVEGGNWRLIIYANTIEYAEHAALVKGDISGPDPVLVRVHAVDYLNDMLGGEHVIPLRQSMQVIAQEQRGAVVLIHDTRPTALSERMKLLKGSDREPLRDYGIGAQILVDLGVKNIVLLSDAVRTVVGLEGFGLNIVERRSTKFVVK